MNEFEKALNYLNNDNIYYVLYGNTKNPDNYFWTMFNLSTFGVVEITSPNDKKRGLLIGLKDFLEETETKENEEIFLKFYAREEKFLISYIVKSDEIKEFKIKNGIVIKQ